MPDSEFFMQNLGFIRPVMIECDENLKTKHIWIATHANPDYAWFAGVGKSSDEAWESLVRILNLVEGKKENGEKDRE